MPGKRNRLSSTSSDSETKALNTPSNNIVAGASNFSLDDFVSSSISPSHGTRALFKYDKNKGWIPETYGSKETVKRSLEPTDSVKRHIKRQNKELNWSLATNFVVTITNTVMKNFKKE